MTAAVARPPLFTNLVASRPSRDAGSIKATAVSLVIHAALIAVALLATQRVVRPAPAVEPIPVLIAPVQIEPAPTSRAPAGDVGAGSSSSIAPPALPAAPSDIPTTINPRAQISDPFQAMRELIDQAGPPARATPGQSPGGYGPTGDFTAYTVGPQLLNRAEVSRLLQRLYPNMLLNAGIGGTVVTWIQIDVSGAVVEARISKSSGHREFDAAALEVAESMRFSPAYNRETRVPVWVELPIVFNTR